MDAKEAPGNQQEQPTSKNPRGNEAILNNHRSTTKDRKRRLPSIRSRATYANVTATLALVFAMSGGALAATHIIITSKSQISKKVLKELKGAAGAKGAAGPAGPTGSAGAQGVAGGKGESGAAGPKGEQGPRGEKGETGYVPVLPAGGTETGTWSYTGPGAGNPQRTTISFPIPLAKGIEKGHIEVITEAAAGGPNCDKGQANEPKAAPGYLCIYVGNLLGFEGAGGSIATEAVTLVNGAELEEGTNTTGGLLHIHEGGAEEGAGTWAVTAPTS